MEQSRGRIKGSVRAKFVLASSLFLPSPLSLFLTYSAPPSFPSSSSLTQPLPLSPLPHLLSPSLFPLLLTYSAPPSFSSLTQPLPLSPHLLSPSLFPLLLSPSLFPLFLTYLVHCTETPVQLQTRPHLRAVSHRRSVPSCRW